MNFQSLFYITASSAIILIALLWVVLMAIAIIIVFKIGRIVHNLSKTAKKISDITHQINVKTKHSILASLVKNGIQEVVKFGKKKYQGKKK